MCGTKHASHRLPSATADERQTKNVNSEKGRREIVRLNSFSLEQIPAVASRVTRVCRGSPVSRDDLDRMVDTPGKSGLP